MTNASLTDLATLKQHGYRVERWDTSATRRSLAGKPVAERGWVLLDPEGANLMIGSHGCIAPTKWEAVAEGLSRIAQDERCERAQGADFFKVILSSEQLRTIECALDTLQPDEQFGAEVASAMSAIRYGAEPVR